MEKYSIWGFFFITLPLFAQEFSSELFIQEAYRFKQNDLPNQRLIFLPKYQSKHFDSGLRYEVSFVTWFNIATEVLHEKSYLESYRFDFDKLAIDYIVDHWSFSLGEFKIDNGETFGAHRPNFLYPKSYENFIFDPEKISGQAQPSGLARYHYEQGTLSLLYVFKTVDFRLPKYISTGKVLSNFPAKKYFKDSEEAIRWNHLFKNSGIELTTVYAQHFSRVPVFTTRINQNKHEFLVTSKKMTSASLSLSKAFNHWVLRGDTTLHKNMPFMKFSENTYVRKNIFDGAFGGTYSKGSSDAITGQFHFVQNYEKDAPLFYSSVWIHHVLKANAFEVDANIYKGINNQDGQYQIDLNSIWGQQNEIHLSYLNFSSRKQGYFKLLEKEQQVQLTWRSCL